jgi:hypothetical protein
MKKIYRRALVDVLDNRGRFKKEFLQRGGEQEETALEYVVHVMKYREIYRHLSHAADRLGHVSELLKDIIVKLV